MAIDLPAQWVEQAQRIDWDSVRAAVADYGPVLTVLRDTWDRETIREIADGHLFVRDAVLNDAIAQSLGTDGTIRSVQLTSHENGLEETVALHLFRRPAADTLCSTPCDEHLQGPLPALYQVQFHAV